MSTIMDLPSGWRHTFQPAAFGGAEFYCEVGSYECGQRVVIHEFPKKDKPYTELMGRRFYAFTVRGYMIQSAREPNYIPAKNRLNDRLERGTPGMLQLPFMRPKHVVCRQWKLTEEDKLGGYCVFDMQFVEASERPFKPTPAPIQIVEQRVTELRERTLEVLSAQYRQLDMPGGVRLTFKDGHSIEQR